MRRKADDPETKAKGKGIGKRRVPARKKAPTEAPDRSGLVAETVLHIMAGGGGVGVRAPLVPEEIELRPAEAETAEPITVKALYAAVKRLCLEAETDWHRKVSLRIDEEGGLVLASAFTSTGNVDLGQLYIDEDSDTEALAQEVFGRAKVTFTAPAAVEREDGMREVRVPSPGGGFTTRLVRMRVPQATPSEGERRQKDLEHLEAQQKVTIMPDRDEDVTFGSIHYRLVRGEIAEVPKPIADIYFQAQRDTQAAKLGRAGVRCMECGKGRLQCECRAWTGHTMGTGASA